MTKKIDLREQVIDFDKQSVITKDNVMTEINALLYFQIVDPVKSVYEIKNLPLAIEKLTQTTLRNVVGEMELDETLTSRDTINSKLRAVLDDATNKWGVKVNRVEIQDIFPPADIQASMDKLMKADREKKIQGLTAFIKTAKENGYDSVEAFMGNNSREDYRQAFMVQDAVQFLIDNAKITVQ